jgi:hypothetical protein
MEDICKVILANGANPFSIFTAAKGWLVAFWAEFFVQMGHLLYFKIVDSVAIT